MLQLIQLLTFVAIFSICALSPILVHFVLPAFNPAIRVIGILAIAGGFAGLAQALNDVTMSLGVKKPVLLNTVSTLLVEIIFLALAWAIFGHIEAIALATLSALFLMCGRSLWLGMRAVRFTKNDVRASLLKTSLRAILAVGLCIVVIELQAYCVDRIDSDLVPMLVLNSLILGLIGASMWTLVRKLRGNSSKG